MDVTYSSLGKVQQTRCQEMAVLIEESILRIDGRSDRGRTDLFLSEALPVE